MPIYMYAVDTQHVRGYEQSPVNALLSGRSERKGSFEITNDNLHAFSSVSDSMHLHESYSKRWTGAAHW